mmetsp:Transcript_43971/g.76594  ORF Transcript_43971/g.76594 Transcript_43971/m.76594 type:complete len:206 (-) Transcript_43971:1543-2160(-)
MCAETFLMKRSVIIISIGLPQFLAFPPHGGHGVGRRSWTHCGCIRGNHYATQAGRRGGERHWRQRRLRIYSIIRWFFFTICFGILFFISIRGNRILRNNLLIRSLGCVNYRSRRERFPSNKFHVRRQIRVVLFRLNQQFRERSARTWHRRFRSVCFGGGFIVINPCRGIACTHGADEQIKHGGLGGGAHKPLHFDRNGRLDRIQV